MHLEISTRQECEFSNDKAESTIASEIDQTLRTLDPQRASALEQAFNAWIPSDDDESPTDTPELWDQTTGTVIPQISTFFRPSLLPNPSLSPSPFTRPASDATREMQIPFRNTLARRSGTVISLVVKIHHAPS